MNHFYYMFTICGHLNDSYCDTRFATVIYDLGMYTDIFSVDARGIS